MMLTHNQPRTPPRLPDNGMRVIPLGGLGEVGRNMTVIEYRGRLLVVDCGVLFPEDDHPGVDLILPDFEYLRGSLDRVEALVLTHGHEDHIGAVPYLLRERADIPVVGSKLTLALLAGKLKEHRIRDVPMVEVAEGQEGTYGPFGCRFVAVNHSVPDALAVAIRTPAGMILHTGDFKLDQLPLDGRLTDLRALARLGEEGVDLFLVDSTNAEVPGFTTAEKEIAPVLDRVIGTSRTRVIVACFASHVHRVQQVLDAAVANGRKVVFVGRSMVRNMGIARDLGFLKVPGNTLIDLKELDNFPRERVVLISTGSQGEPMSALARIAARDHPFIEIAPGDTVVLASSLIPGNENAVFRVINGLTRCGAEVVHKGNALVHTSGHASAGELLYTYNIVQPRNVLPVHGEPRHLLANGELAVATGVPSDRVMLVEDGGVIDLVDGVARVTGQIECGYVFVDGSTVGDISEASLKDRRILGDEGFISVVVVVDFPHRSIVAGPEVHARGFAEDDAVFAPVISQLSQAVKDSLSNGTADVHTLQQVVRRTMGRWVNQRHRRRPMIIPVVIEG